MKYEDVPTGVARDRDSDREVFSRKDEHLTFATQFDEQASQASSFARYRICHRALPGHDLEDVDLATTFLGRRLEAPIIISSMTGGTARAKVVNERLAIAAHECGLAMALGSGRAALIDPTVVGSYVAGPRPPVRLANLGAVQLRKGLTAADAEKLVDLLHADGLIVHLNPLQEAVQPGGDTTFAGLTDAIAAVVDRLQPRPVIVKEVGFGLGPTDVPALLGAGVTAIDVAGSGGTNWAIVEGMRDPHAEAIAAAFARWGWPTTVALRHARRIAPRPYPIIASGGIRDGVDGGIAFALGASLIGLARPMLLAAIDNRAQEVASILIRQLRIAIWLAGAERPLDLRESDVWET